MPYMMHCQAQVKANRGAAEVILGLKQIVFSMIRNFIQRTRYKPRRIIFYRDGVGDGQFEEVS